ncbi:hypothetical protein JOF53_001034 [Crossiella equi]|uniref:Protein kinase domain-containing protein n=1 Tax=Crossiella equi TaxID=130796 RepID=A0ABS5A6E4_9PSEU|nr:hypothetical protein [Crossiella equi]MBP2472162.1 hypothetical protein [Crossiella equi]
MSTGTPGYLAPEVVAEVRVTGAADFYALGVTLAAVAEGRADRRLTEVLAAFTVDDPARRPGIAKATRMLRELIQRRTRESRVAVAFGAAAAVAAAAVPLWPEAPPTDQHTAQPGGRTELLFGLGDQLNSALAAELVRETPVRVLTTNYHKPSDLTKLASWRDALVADAYAQGYALHMVVADWETDDPEVPVDTEYGVGCGRAHPLSADFPRHMRTLARAFAGKADGPPLYVTVFQEIKKFACVDGAYAAEPATTAYYRALQDRYREVREEAPNARVALGWDAWQARDDDPGTGAGRSMFAHFAETLRASDFQSVLAKQPDGNVEDVRGSVRALGAYAPVMVAAYGNKRTAEVIGRDVRALFTEHSLAELTRHRLFAWNFNTVSVLTEADRPTRDFVKDVVRRVGRDPR